MFSRIGVNSTFFQWQRSEQLAFYMGEDYLGLQAALTCKRLYGNAVSQFKALFMVLALSV